MPEDLSDRSYRRPHHPSTPPRLSWLAPPRVLDDGPTSPATSSSRAPRFLGARSTPWFCAILLAVVAAWTIPSTLEAEAAPEAAAALPNELPSSLPAMFQVSGDLPDSLDPVARQRAERGLAIPGMEDPAIRLDPVAVPGLRQSVRVRRDGNGVPHIFALEDHDALFVLGWLHAEDRFFQMDVLRRTFSGTLAEILGDGALPSDLQFRTLGLRRAAERSEPLVSDGARVWLEAYAAGVNAWLAARPLPPEYGPLELSRAADWTVLDTLTVNKGLAFGLSFGLDEIDFTTALMTFQQAGEIFGFDGTALFAADLYRSAPFEPLASIPAAASVPISSQGKQGRADRKPGGLALPDSARLPDLAALVDARAPVAAEADAPSRSERVLGMLRDYREQIRDLPWLGNALDRDDSPTGSNWWVFDGSTTESGYPMLANDPHLGLDTPAVFYEVQIRVAAGVDPPMNVFGVSFPGTAGIIQGCNPWICWGSTVNPMDVTDVYLEELVFSGLTVSTRYQGELEPAQLLFQGYLTNQIGDSELDNLVDGTGIPELDDPVVVVPRRNHGPIIAIEATGPGVPVGLSVQYTGWSGTRESDFVRNTARARSVSAFRSALEFFDVGSQNWSVADREGTIAYFTSAEMPLRDDLQNLNQPDGGVPPWLIRDGTGELRHEWLPVTNPQPNQAVPYEILPAEEMPHVVAPAAGFVLNCNNDPVGTTFDNNPLNQLRPGGGLYYLSPGYATGFRQGRLGRLVDEELSSTGNVDLDAIRAFQANNQLLDAEILLPYLLDAWEHAMVSDNPTLAALAGDRGLGEAIGRLEFWDFSTPTGIPEGWDPGDDPSALPMPDPNEADASVAATIYSTWRGQAVQTIIDGTLDTLGLADLAPGSSVSMAALRNLLDTFEQTEGRGASGLQFFPGEGEVAAESRDTLLLGALRSALDLLASDTFAPAFENSTDQADYRWGFLHRIVFDHPLGAPFSIPPAGMLADLDENLPGLARAGGLGALDASSHGARADGPNEFMFGSGPARRFLGILTPEGPDAWEVIPGGQSGVLGSPYQADQLRLWLVNDYHPFVWRPLEVIPITETFQEFLSQGN